MKTHSTVILGLPHSVVRAISNKERLRRKKEAEKRRRERIKSDPKFLADENQKRRERYARKKKEQAKNGKKESKRVIEARRRKWRIAKQRYLEKKKLSGKKNTRDDSIQIKLENEEKPDDQTCESILPD